VERLGGEKAEFKLKAQALKLEDSIWHPFRFETPTAIDHTVQQFTMELDPTSIATGTG
jgi:hypothetical protein